jgi:hypothetical protein
MHAMTRNHREDSRRRALVGIALLLGLASTFGCGEGRAGGGASVRGRVVRDGEPLPLDERLAGAGAAYVQVGFQRIEGADRFGDATTLIAAPDGTFVVPGLLPGRYRVTVEYFNGEPNDLLSGRFGTANSPLTFEMGDSAVENHVIDVGGRR